VKERGLIFSAPMVRAILAGRKTQSRRIIKLREFQPSETRGYDWTFRDRRGLWQDYPTAKLLAERVPFGVAGDRLWVREGIRWDDEAQRGIYLADGAPSVVTEWPWKSQNLSPLFMPRGASRIQLELTSVRVQRVDDITEEDAQAEGVEPMRDHEADIEGDCWTSRSDVYRAAFEFAWNEIHGWNPNAFALRPWVWCLTFKRVERP
jgi:hypothetical protein